MPRCRCCMQKKAGIRDAGKYTLRENLLSGAQA
jgi:hypothetical protein